MNHRNRLIAVPSNLNLNVRHPFFELTLKVNGIKIGIGIAIAINGLLVAVQRFDQRLIIAIGKWGNRR